MTNTKKKTENKKNEQNKNKEESVLQRLAQASIEGLAIQAAVNTIMPGAGLALKSLKSAKTLKKAGKIMGKSAGKEGVKMLDDEERGKQTTPEELSGDVALAALDRIGGRS